MYFRLEVSLEKPLTQSHDISLCTNNTWHLAKHVTDTYQQPIPCSKALTENLSITHPFSKFTPLTKFAVSLPCSQQLFNGPYPGHRNPFHPIFETPF